MSGQDVTCRQIADAKVVEVGTWDSAPVDIGVYTGGLADTSPMTLQLSVAGAGASVSASPLLSIDGTYISPTGIGDICTTVPNATESLSTRYMFGFNTPVAGRMKIRFTVSGAAATITAWLAML